MPQMIEVRTADLIGKPLDYAVAQIEGWQWARNASRRSGDSFAQYHDRNAKPRWPIGALCFIRPNAAKELSAEVVNWDGWLLPKGGELLAPAAFHDLPRFSTRWGEGGPLIRKYGVALIPEAHDGAEGTEMSERFYADVYFAGGEQYTTDVCDEPLVAVCRAVVATVFGDVVLIPAELLQEVSP